MITRYFVRAEAWQLCLMMVVPYGVYKFTGFGGNPVERGMLMFYFLFVAIGWMYSVGIRANEKLDSEFRLSPLFINIAVFIPFMYLPLFIVEFLIPVYQGRVQSPPQWLMIAHFFTIFCIGYCIWFAAKQYTTLKKNEETNFFDYYPAFMGFWFGFIGVWFLQPKIKQLLGDDA